MKILHVSKFYPPYRGGIEDVCYSIVKSLCFDCEQRVICFSNNTSDVLSNVDGVMVIRAGVMLEVLRQPLSLSLYIMLRRYISTFNPDIIHLHLPNPLVCFYLLTLIPKSVKLVLHWHSDVVAQNYVYKLFRPIEYLLLKRSNKIIVTSPQYLENSIPLHQFQMKSVIVPNMISLDKMKMNDSLNCKVNDFLSFYGKKKIVFFMGRHVNYKGLKYLIEAEKYIESDCVILIAGQGPLTMQLKKSASSERIKFVGRISDEEIKIYMSAASVFAFPSITKNEAFGVVLAEAMYARAVPVTFTISGSGVNWVNIHKITGLEVENRNSEKFGRAIDLLLKNEKLRSELAESGYKRVIDNFTMDTIKPQIMNIYNELLHD